MNTARWFINQKIFFEKVKDFAKHLSYKNQINFGWGKVNNVYPQTTLTYIDSTTNVIICNGESFNRDRYIGGK